MCGNTHFVCIMRNIRLIARLDVKWSSVIKEVHLEYICIMEKALMLYTEEMIYIEHGNNR